MRSTHMLMATLMLALVSACGGESPEAVAPAAGSETAATDTAPQTEAETPAGDTTPGSLDDILAAQPEEAQARYVHRHPKETLEFFGIAPGMTVVEALPGGGWYSKILLPYLGEGGHLVGVNYAPDIWPNFSFANEEFLASMAEWSTAWPAGAEEWRTERHASVSAFVFGDVDPAMVGTVDAVLFIRALHNMARFGDQRDFLGEAFTNAFDVLKPGGVVGIVQHEARADMPEDWANGTNGYLKRDFVIAQMEAAGFEFAGASEVNQNPSDQPTAEEFVWRLPPSLRTARDNPELAAQLTAIGESNRMTLKFVKPAA